MPILVVVHKKSILFTLIEKAVSHSGTAFCNLSSSGLFGKCVVNSLCLNNRLFFIAKCNTLNVNIDAFDRITCKAFYLFLDYLLSSQQTSGMRSPYFTAIYASTTISGESPSEIVILTPLTVSSETQVSHETRICRSNTFNAVQSFCGKLCYDIFRYPDLSFRLDWSIVAPATISSVSPASLTTNSSFYSRPCGYSSLSTTGCVLLSRILLLF